MVNANLTSVSPLMQPVVYNGQEYCTSQYLQQFYITQDPQATLYQRHDNFLRLIRTMPAYHLHLTCGDVILLKWSQFKAEYPEAVAILRLVFQMTTYHNMTLLNVTAQSAFAEHLLNRDVILGRRKPPEERYNGSEKSRAYHAEYRATRREKARQQTREWVAANPEKSREAIRLYNATHKAEAKVRNALHYQENAEELKANQRAYYREHPGEALINNARRRARVHNAPVNDFTHAQWIDMQAAYDHRCAYCGKRCKGKLTKDHIIPLSKGGSNTLSNIVPACRTCNGRKNAGPILQPVQPMLLTAILEPKKKVRTK